MALEDLAGRRLGDYRLISCIGHGGGTAVYEADAGDDLCAIKLVDSRLERSDELIDRLRREAGVLEKIGHRGILPIRDATRAGDLSLAAMPLKRGTTTLHAMMAKGPLDTETAWTILEQIAAALDAVHQRGLVYRVLKPLNVLVDDSGRAHLAEFGITSQWVGRLALATPEFLVSDPQYLAPEQLQGREIDQRADVYAFAMLAFELATGGPMYAAEPAEIYRAALHAPVPSAAARNPSLPPGVDLVFERALASDPEARHRTVTELLENMVDVPEPAPGLPEPATGPPVRLPALVMDGIVPEEQNVLDTFLALCLRAGAEVAGPRWSSVLALAGWDPGLTEPRPGVGLYVPALFPLSRLAAGFDAIFEGAAPEHEREWGRLVGLRWLEAIQTRPPWMAGPPTGRLADLLSVFLESLNRVRGEELHGWRQVGRPLFRVVHRRNLMAVGRRRPGEACHFWRGAYEAGLVWAGLEKDWLVAEVECGCANGTDDCVFTFVRAAPS